MQLVGSPFVGLSRRDGRIIRLYVTERPAKEPNLILF